MKPIVGANHRATKIEITLPIDESGEYAFDENGDPVEGRQPVIISVPRFDCMTREQFKDLSGKLEAAGKKKNLTPQERSFELVVTMLEPFVTDDQVKLIDKLCLFEVEQIAERIQEGSSMSVGELLASTGSSTSTAGPSKLTSSHTSE